MSWLSPRGRCDATRSNSIRDPSLSAARVWNEYYPDSPRERKVSGGVAIATQYQHREQPRGSGTMFSFLYTRSSTDVRLANKPRPPRLPPPILPTRTTRLTPRPCYVVARRPDARGLHQRQTVRCRAPSPVPRSLGHPDCHCRSDPEHQR